MKIQTLQNISCNGNLFNFKNNNNNLLFNKVNQYSANKNDRMEEKLTAMASGD